MHFCCDARVATHHFPGIGRYVFHLLKAMVPLLSEHERLTVLRDPRQASHWDLSSLAARNVRMVNSRVSFFSVRQQWVIPSLLRHLGVGVYHCPYYLMPYFTGVPTILTVYDLIPLKYPQHVSLRARMLFRLATSMALRRACRVIAISKNTRRDLTRSFHLDQKSVASIPLAADARFVPQTPAEIKRVRRRYDLAERFVLYLGINKPHKNLSRLIDAWKLASPEFSAGNRPVELVMAGAWDDRYGSLRERASRTNRVRILGSVDEQDLPAIYSSAEFFVYPSLCEGFGLPVLEAMACGAAVTCSRAPGLTELVGDAALLFNPQRPEEIANALRSLLTQKHALDDLRSRSGERAKCFSWDRTARETLDVYRQAASEPKS